MIARRRLASFLAAGLIAAGLAVAPVQAPAQGREFGPWLEELRGEAIAQGIRRSTLDVALAGLQPDPRVIERDRRQPEFTLSFRQYMDRVVSQGRVDGGRQRLREHQRLLDEIANKYGVPARFIVAFWAVESDFGRIAGGFPVVQSLATLAFDGRRSSYFRGELINALRILDGNHVAVDKMLGSWAGAMGQCQFMPSSFLSYAVDYDGDGRKDIWNSRADVFASTANYLARSGWRNDQTWGRPVSVPATVDSGLAGVNVRKPLVEWQALGIRRDNGAPLPGRDLQASLILTEGPGSAAFLVYDNFRTILKWNRSNFFAIAVGSLADLIGDS